MSESDKVNTRYRVKLNIFEGPLDLLLHLIKKNEVDIYDIPIAEITRQYMEYLDFLKTINLEVAGEFLVMAATLMHIKSKMLLPEKEGEEGEEEMEDPRADLVQRLLEYQRFKEAALVLNSRDLLGREVFTRGLKPLDLDEVGGTMPNLEVSLFDLIDAFNCILKKMPKEDYEEITMDRMSIKEKMSMLIDLIEDKKSLNFNEILMTGRDRFDLILTFLAILELVRIRAIRIFQEKMFGTINVYKI